MGFDRDGSKGKTHLDVLDQARLDELKGAGLFGGAERE